jgi:hypothetical protein
MLDGGRGVMKKRTTEARGRRNDWLLPADPTMPYAGQPEAWAVVAVEQTPETLL